MARDETTSEIIDTILKYAVVGSAMTAGIIVPNTLIGLEKPLKSFLRHMNKRERERETRRVISYMKSQGLLKGDYEHGLNITKKGYQRLLKLDFEKLRVSAPRKWDHIWRLVIYDIPKEYNGGRRALSSKLRELGFFQLQQSVWIHPFPCREIIEKVTDRYRIARYVSYIEALQLDNQQVLVQRFKKRQPQVSFK